MRFGIIVEAGGCPNCGNDLTARTSAPDGLFYDGDAVRCVECEHRTEMVVDGGEAWVRHGGVGCECPACFLPGERDRG